VKKVEPVGVPNLAHDVATAFEHVRRLHPNDGHDSVRSRSAIFVVVRSAVCVAVVLRLLGKACLPFPATTVQRAGSVPDFSVR
jgi:hypothetical protein